MSDDILVQVINLLRDAYIVTDNDKRREYVEQLLIFEDALDGPTALQVGIRLLQTQAESCVVQSYGAVILKKSLIKNLVSPVDIPFRELLVWTFEDANLSRLLGMDLLDLIVEVALRLPVETLLEIFSLCSIPSNADQGHKQMRTIGALVRSILEPSNETARIPGIRHLQLCVEQHAVELVRITVLRLQELFQDETHLPSLELSFQGKLTLEASSTVLSNLTHCLSAESWDELQLGNAFLALLSWIPTRNTAMSIATEIIQNIHDSGKPELLPMRDKLLSCAVDTAALCAASLESYDTIEEMLEFLERVDSMAILHATLEKIVNLCFQILSIPSLRFATRVCTVLLAVKDQALKFLHIFDFCERIFFFLQKHLLHPQHGSHAAGRAISQAQIETEVLYDSCFGDFRNLAGQFLTALSNFQPEQCNAQILYRIQQLPDPSGTEQDPRTHSGFVTQRSPTYVLWDATAFMIVRLSDSFRFSNAHVSEAMNHFLTKNTADAVLRPSYLDILRSFWNYEGPDDLVVWKGSMDILLSDLELSQPHVLDEDVLAARRRVATLLIRSTKYAHRFLSIVPDVIKRLSPLLLRTTGQERSFLYEASSYFCMALNPLEGDTHLRDMLNPIVVHMELVVSEMTTQDSFNALLTQQNNENLRKPTELQEALSIMGSSLNGLAETPSPYLLEVTQRLQLVLRRLFQLLHGVLTSALLPSFESMIYMSHFEAINFLYGHSRKSHIDRTALGVARQNLSTIRFSLYQLQGLLSRWLDSTQIFGMFPGLFESLPYMPIHWMRTFLQQGLLPMVQQREDMVEPIVDMLISYCQQNPLAMPLKVPNLTKEQEEEIKMRIWRGFVMGVIVGIVEKAVIGPDFWKRNHQLFRKGCDLLLLLSTHSHAEKAARIIRKCLDATPEADRKALHDLHLYAFGTTVKILVFSSDPTFTFEGREYISFLTSRFFLAHFEDVMSVLEEIGSPPEEVENLRRLLLVTRKENAQKQKCKEFLLKLRASLTGGNV